MTNLAKLMKNAQDVSFLANTEFDSDIDMIQFLIKDKFDYTTFSGPVRCYTKFNITPAEVDYSDEEHGFRIVCMKEELDELEGALKEKDIKETIDALVDLLFFAIGTSYRSKNIIHSIVSYKSYSTCSAQLMIDAENNSVEPEKFLIETIKNLIDDVDSTYLKYKNGFKYAAKLSKLISFVTLYILTKYDKQLINVYYERVTQANLSKEIGSLPKRGSFSIDLKKPEGWTPPSFDGLQI